VAQGKISTLSIPDQYSFRPKIGIVLAFDAMTSTKATPICNSSRSAALNEFDDADGLMPSQARTLLQ
jgi:hypothetical protein